MTICPSCRIPCNVPVTIKGSPGDVQTYFRCPQCSLFSDSPEHRGVCIECGGKGYLTAVDGRNLRATGIMTETRRPCDLCNGTPFSDFSAAFTEEEGRQAQASILSQLIRGQ